MGMRSERPERGRFIIQYGACLVLSCTGWRRAIGGPWCDELTRSAGAGEDGRCREARVDERRVALRAPGSQTQPR